MAVGRVRNLLIRTTAARNNSEPLNIDLVFADFVVNHTSGRSQQACRLRAIAAGCLEGVDNKVLFVSRNGIGKRNCVYGAGSLRRLQGRRQMMTVHDFAFANQNGPLDHIFQLANVPGPMIRREHVDRGGRDAAYVFLVFS